MAGNEVKFGEAWVEIHAKLDDYDREIAQVEQRTTRAIERIETQSRGLTQQFRDLGQGASGFTEAGEAIARTTFRIGLLYTSTRLARAGMTQLASALGTVARFLGSMPVLILTIAAHLGDVIRFARSVPDRLRSFWDWLRTPIDLRAIFTNLSVGVDGFMRRIPILSSLWTGLARTVSEVSELLGGPNFDREIDEARERTRQLTEQMMALRRATEAIRLDDSLLNRARELGDAERLVGLEGVARLREEEKQALEDMERSKNAIRRRAHEDWQREITQLRRQAARAQGLEGDMPELLPEFDEAAFRRDFATQIEALNTRRTQAMERAEKSFADAVQAQRRLSAALIAQAEQEDAMRRIEQIEALQSQIIEARVNLEAIGFDRQAQHIRVSFRRQILAAEREGDAERAALLRELADLRIEEVRRREEQRFEAQAEAIRANAQRIGQEIRRAELEAQGDELALRLFDIDTDIDRRSDELAEWLSRLRDEFAALKETMTFADMDRAMGLAAQIRDVEQMIEALERLRRARRDAAEQQDAERRNRQLEDVMARNVQLMHEVNGRRDLAELAALEHRFTREIEKARAAGADELVRQLELQRDLEKQLLAQRNVGEFRQVDIRELGRSPLERGGAAAEALHPDDGAAQEGVKVQRLSLEELRAIRDAVARGVPAFVN